MIQKTTILILSILILSSCTSKNSKTQSKANLLEDIHLSSLIETSQIDSVLMNNNSGTHFIENSKLEEFKLKLGNMTLDRGSYKMGAINFSIYIKGNPYSFSGRTHGDFIETHSDIITKNKSWIDQEWIYFKTNNLNLDNY